MRQGVSPENMAYLAGLKPRTTGFLAAAATRISCIDATRLRVRRGRPAYRGKKRRRVKTTPIPSESQALETK